METDITGFAEQYRVRTQRDSLGEAFIPCQPSQTCHHDGDTFGVMVINEGKALFTPKVWENIRRDLLVVGFTLHLNSDTDPNQPPRKSAV
jgi:hypothetical protein